jgi:hypothetical protein
MKTSNYTRSIKVINWGCSFDSILELKYTVSIQKEYEFLRSQIPIYYDPRTKFPTNYIRENIRRYTPDFLIRHKVTRKAFLVEIKPRAFEGNEQLLLRREVAENYIRWKRYDWKFKVVYDDEIELTADERAQFLECRKLIPLSERRRLFKGLNDKFESNRPPLLTSVPSNRKIHFVMFGDENHLNESKLFTV